MQNSLLKRGFLPQMQTMEIDEQECGYQQPRKFIKKSLEIEIPEIHADENIPPPIPSLCSQSSKFVLHAFKNLQPIKGLTSTPTRYTDLPGKGLDFGNIFTDSNTKYDNYYEEEEFYSIVMEKCHRKAMEDRAICEKILDPQLKVSFFGVYDGHTNTYACDFLQKNLHRCIINHPDFITQPNLALKEAFERIDQEICRNQEKFNIQGGSTALCAMFDSQTVRIANVGDCKAVLIHNGEPITLNVEHRASNEDEKQRVESRGGFILEKKGKTTVRQMVQGSLELTRSIGDQAYKQYITCEPDILEYQLGEGDEYLLLGSDGFWNELSEREVADLIKSFKSTKGLSRFLVDQALQKRNYNIDNITLIVISLQEYARFRQMIDEN